MNFAGKFADYNFIPAGNSLNVLSGTTKIANVEIQDDSNGKVLNFDGALYSAHFVNGIMPLKIEITGIETVS